jgi:phosphopantetheine--protein transferase-like protein
MNSLDDFIKNLTGREGLSLSNLTSAQKARAIAWARVSGVSVDEVNNSSPLVLEAPVERTTSTANGALGGSAMIGVDIQSVSEFFPVNIHDLKSDKPLLKIFTMAEIAYAESKDQPLNHLTGIFALKESIMKASGVLLSDLSTLEILHKNEKPTYRNFSLSLSYTGDLVVGIAYSNASQSSDSNEINDINRRILKLENDKVTQCPSPSPSPSYIGSFVAKSALAVTALGSVCYYLITAWPF